MLSIEIVSKLIEELRMYIHVPNVSVLRASIVEHE